MSIIHTKAARSKIGDPRLGTPHDIEEYTSPSGDTLILTTSEREDIDLEFPDDTLTAPQFADLLNKLIEAGFIPKPTQCASSSGVLFFDRNGLPLCVGQRVRVKHCSGSYGQTTTVSGELIRIGDYGNVYIKTDTPQQRWNGKGYIDAGACLYPNFTIDKSLGEKALRGCGEHYDFEHGHTTFIEIVAPLV